MDNPLTEGERLPNGATVIKARTVARRKGKPHLSVVLASKPGAYLTCTFNHATESVAAELKQQRYVRAYTDFARRSQSFKA